MIVRSGQPRRGAARFDIAMTLAFLLLLVVNTWHHEPWSDELHAWGLVLASPDPIALFRNLHYEGHPGLWHILLWLAALFTNAPLAMQGVHFVIAALVCVMIGIVSPFSRLEKFLVLSNYYVVFEYAVVARNYAIGLLVALVYAWARANFPDRREWQGALLGMLANTNIYGTIMSMAFAAESGFCALLGWRTMAQAPRWRFVAGCAMFLALLAFGIATLMPAVDISHHAQERTFGLAQILDFHDVYESALRFFVAPFAPFDLKFPSRFAFAGDYMPTRPGWLMPLVLVGFVAALIWSFRRQPALLLAFGMTAAGGTVFAHLIYPAYARQFGISFVAFIVVLWIARRRGLARATLPLMFLALGAAGGVVAEIGQWERPFSNVGPAARWLRAHQLADAPLVGVDDIREAAIAITLHRPMYFLACDCENTYARLDNRRDRFAWDQVPGRLALAVRAIGRQPIVVITATGFSDEDRARIAAAGVILVPLTRFAGAERDSRFEFYLVE